MQIRIITAGKPSLRYVRSGVGEYLERQAPSRRPVLIHVKAGTSGETSARLLDASRGCYRVALDERGDLLATRAFAETLARLESRGNVKTIAFLIGPADGHSETLRAACDRLISLSPLTLQHELALLVLLEQLYRVASLRSGAPYHRE